MTTETATRRPFTDKGFQPQSKRRETKVSEMSPEARRAMLLAREDTKENFMTISKPLKPPLPALSAQRQNANLNGTKKQTFKKPVPRDQSRGSASSVKDSKTTLRSSRGAQPQPTARSRSTLSHTDHTSDRIDNRPSQQPAKASNHSTGSVGEKNVYLTTGNSQLDENNAGSSNIEASFDDEDVEYKESNVTEADEWANVEYTSQEQGEAVSTTDANNNSDSFALALHKALDESRAVRLRGDITDNAGISEPGTVRALNGGRLTNAQEVVVNVCYDDGKELVFHDDDYESLETAKTISQIRINVWLEHSEKFAKDCAYEHEDLSNTHANEESDDTDMRDYGRSQTNLSPDTMKNSRTSQTKGKPVARPNVNDKTQQQQTSRMRSAIPNTPRSKSTLPPNKNEPFLRRKAKA